VSKLLLTLLTLPLLAIAEDRVLDLTYNPPLDYNYCDNNPVECRPLPPLIAKFELYETATTKQWLAFWTFQVLDAYSTSRAVKYDCIKEVNPLYTEHPSNTRIVLTKSALLLPGLLYDDYYKTVSPEELNDTNKLYSVVVVSNFRLLNQAKDTCNKIR
jgi:hypothetical protein